MYVTVISQVFKENNALLFELLLLELKFYQNVITDSMQSFKLLHEFTVHYIKTKNENIFYKFLYNLLLKKFKML